MPIANQNVTIIRAHRKTVSLQINSDATLTVKIPWFMPKKVAFDFIAEKQEWISMKQKQIGARSVASSKKKFEVGETFHYLGIEYPLKIISAQSTPLQLTKTHFSLCQFNKEKADQYFLAWYKKQALDVITRRVQLFANEHKLKYGAIKIADTNSQWGSCSPEGNLSFKWQIIMAPLMVVDYVVAHELAHITEKNHSVGFWNQVQTMYPQYKIYRRWLKQNGDTLHM